jgi:site-specific recombinase XerC
MKVRKPRLDPWIEGYLDYLRDVRRVSDRSLSDRRCTFRHASAALGALRPEVPLWKLSLQDYLVWVSREREAGCPGSTLSKHISYLRGLLDYAWKSGQSDRNPLDGFSIQDDGQRRKEPQSLSLEDARLLVEASRKLSRRDRVMVLIFYGCGLRTNELRWLDVQDVDLERQERFVRRAKGNRPRRVPVPGGVWTELLAYLAECKGKRGALFRSSPKGPRIAEREIGAAIKGAANMAELKVKLTPKVLRHTFGTHLMDCGVDVAVIASLMGHRSPAESGVYLHALPGRKEAAVEKLTLKGGGQ